MRRERVRGQMSGTEQGRRNGVTACMDSDRLRMGSAELQCRVCTDPDSGSGSEALLKPLAAMKPPEHPKTPPRHLTLAVG